MAIQLSDAWLFSTALATFLILATLTTSCSADDVSVLPTVIVRQPTDNAQRNRPGMVYGDKVYALPGSSFSLPCVALGSGNAAPVYYWTVNDVRFNGSLVLYGTTVATYTPNNGTLFFNNFIPEASGYFQCFASNGPNRQYVAVSDVVRLAAYSVPTHFGTPREENVTAYVGDSRKFMCDPVRLNFDPPGTVTWVDSDNNPVLNDRLVMDPFGDLHIVKVTSDGPETLSRLHCRVSQKGAGIDVDNRLSWQVSILNSSVSVPSRGPLLLFPARQETYYTFIEGEAAKITCIFSGNPVPTVTFLSPSQAEKKGNTLSWSRISQADAGAYTCRGANSMSWSEAKLFVNVVVRPTFISPTLKDVVGFNVTVGQDLTIDCNTNAHPPADVIWFVNGVRTNKLPESLPFADRLVLTGGNTRYTLLKAAKTDNHVVQCNASNIYGYAFGSFYVNVLNRTKIIAGPKNLSLDPSSNMSLPGVCPKTLECATSVDKMNVDDGTFRVTWYRAPSLRPKDDDFSLLNTKGKEQNSSFMQTSGGLCINYDLFPDDRVSKLGGTYKCRAENGVSVDEATAIIHFNADEQLQLATALMSTASFEWWIVILAACILLIITIILAVVLSIYRRRGGSYLVDQQERAQGNDPEKEMKRDGFADYIRPDQDPKKGSSASMESVKMAYDDDEESLDEFADIDHTKFGEDGSFIGQYARGNKRERDRDRNREAPATFDERERFTASYNYA